MMGAERKAGATQTRWSEHQLRRIQQRVHPRRQQLLCHPIYDAIDSVENLRLFMQSHAFAVWDFMSLLKSLQQRLCGSRVPWLPPADPAAARLVNEIVLGEETDVDGRGSYLSHFGLYHRAMRRSQTDTTMIDVFLDAISRGNSVQSSLAVCHAPHYVREFVMHTFDVIARGNLCEIAAVFTFSREDLLPSVFQRIVDVLNMKSGGELNEFRYYLDRHIEIDTDEHGPMALQMLATLCGCEAENWQTAGDAAAAGLDMRYQLWHGIYSSMVDSGEHAPELRAQTRQERITT